MLLFSEFVAFVDKMELADSSSDFDNVSLELLSTLLSVPDSELELISITTGALEILQGSYVFFLVFTQDRSISAYGIVGIANRDGQVELPQIVVPLPGCASIPK